jgi:hypothetical protein
MSRRKASHNKLQSRYSSAAVLTKVRQQQLLNLHKSYHNASRQNSRTHLPERGAYALWRKRRHSRPSNVFCLSKRAKRIQSLRVLAFVEGNSSVLNAHSLTARLHMYALVLNITLETNWVRTSCAHVQDPTSTLQRTLATVLPMNSSASAPYNSSVLPSSIDTLLQLSP